MAKRRPRRTHKLYTELALVWVIALIVSLNIGSKFDGFVHAGMIILAVTLALILLVVAAIVVRQHQRNLRRLEALRTLKLTDIDRLTGVQFERYIAEVMTSQGFKVTTTPMTGDLGVDLVAKKDGTTYAIQLKCYGKPLGPPAIQQAVAGMAHYKCSAAMVITNNYFTRHAVTLAKSNNCILINRDVLAQWVVAFQARQTRPYS
jgi:restriction system protein